MGAQKYKVMWLRSWSDVFTVINELIKTLKTQEGRVTSKCRRGLKP